MGGAVTVGVSLLVWLSASLWAFFARRNYWGHFSVLAALACLCLSLLWQASNFSDRSLAGPGAIPFLWGGSLLFLSIWLLVGIFKQTQKPDPKSGNLLNVVLAITLLVLYLVSMEWMGYFLASFVFLVLTMQLFRLQNWMLSASVAAGWCLFSYTIFYRLLSIQLPVGSLWE